MAAARASWKISQGGAGILGMGPNGGIGISIVDDRGDPAWTNTLSFVAIGFMSASLGVQGIMHHGQTPQHPVHPHEFVLTTVWVELVSDPRPFSLRQSVITRDHKLIAAFSLVLGAFVSRTILYKLGAAGALGVDVHSLHPPGSLLLPTNSLIQIPQQTALASQDRQSKQGPNVCFLWRHTQSPTLPIIHSGVTAASVVETRLAARHQRSDKLLIVPSRRL
ncbi:hypothetical protein EYR36_005082 [Pleurotus pulmonarius]|nr:hypothetical protein EYR36_005082 [Pleurotus pulmonarius]